MRDSGSPSSHLTPSGMEEMAVAKTARTRAPYADLEDLGGPPRSRNESRDSLLGCITWGQVKNRRGQGQEAAPWLRTHAKVEVRQSLAGCGN